MIDYIEGYLTTARRYYHPVALHLTSALCRAWWYPGIVTPALRPRRCCGPTTIMKEKCHGSSRYINVLGRARLDPGSRTPHHHVWWEYVVCECRLSRAHHHL